MWHDWPGFSSLPVQSSVRLYGASTVRPVPDMRSGLGLTFVTVTDCVGAVAPTRTGPKSSLVGVSTSVGATPVPDIFTVYFFPFHRPVAVANVSPTPVGENV